MAKRNWKQKTPPAGSSPIEGLGFAFQGVAERVIPLAKVLRSLVIGPAHASFWRFLLPAEDFFHRCCSKLHAPRNLNTECEFCGLHGCSNNEARKFLRGRKTSGDPRRTLVVFLPLA